MMTDDPRKFEMDRMHDEIATLRARVKALESAQSAQGARVPEGEAIQQIKNRMDVRLNNRLCEMKEGWDDSVVGFNDAWDIMRAVFADLAAAPPAPSALTITDEMVERAAIKLHEIARQHRSAGKRGIPRWETELPEYRDHLRSTARAALHAALGQEKG